MDAKASMDDPPVKPLESDKFIKNIMKKPMKMRVANITFSSWSDSNSFLLLKIILIPLIKYIKTIRNIKKIVKTKYIFVGVTSQIFS
jgi:hypothetical protein